MLDRATIENLSKAPEKNAPALNVALAEEGTAPVLLALAGCASVGADALSVIGARIAKEGSFVGHDRGSGTEDTFTSPLPDLERMLIAHPNAPEDLRDIVLAKHVEDAYFVLAAACHPKATLGAVTTLVEWEAASPMHDRLWIALIEPSLIPPLVMEEWSQDSDPRRRETIAKIAREPSLLKALLHDKARNVRRALASNRFAGEIRKVLAEKDTAAEVRLRAQGALTAHGEHGAELARYTESAKFAAALRAMSTGGVLAPDVTRALSLLPLDSEGALYAALVLNRRDVTPVLEKLLDQGIGTPLSLHFAAGLGLRPPAAMGSPSEMSDEALAEHAELVYDALKSLSRTTTAESKLTGKARFAAWIADGLAKSEAVTGEFILKELGKNPLAADRMVLARTFAISDRFAKSVWKALADNTYLDAIPMSLLELAWHDPQVPDSLVADLAVRVSKPKKREEDLPEDEADFDPLLRSEDTLSKVVLTASSRVAITPRAALTAIALDARRVRYVLSAMPQWKGRVSGAKLSRVLRQHAGALTVAQSEQRARASRVESWTHRKLSELELGIALAVGHITGEEVAHRLNQGSQSIDDGHSLAFGAEARAALEGAASIAPLLQWAAKHRSAQPAALTVWLLLERFDRERVPSLIASAMDALVTEKAPAYPNVIDALALMERRKPGRLEQIHAQSAKGRATMASAIAKAYRAVGGMSHERQGP